MRYAPRALLAGGLGFAVSFLVACGGGSGLLSGDDAATLNDQLDRVSMAVDRGQCAAATREAAALAAQVRQLPLSVKRTLRRNLAQGADTVAQLAQQNCHPATHPHTTSTQTTTTTVPTNTNTTPTNTNTTPTQTQPPPQTNPNTTTQPPVTNPGGPGTTSTGSSGGAGFGGGNGTGGAGDGNGNGKGKGNGQ